MKYYCIFTEYESGRTRNYLMAADTVIIYDSDWVSQVRLYFY